jgi:cyclopropane-fatty-acyl-phospholipid synthase
LIVHNERFFARTLLGGDVGLGEAYMDGDWSSPDLVSVVRLLVRNMASLERSGRISSMLRRALERVNHRRRANTPSGSRKNIHAHYDLNNDFFALFLDRNMLYSCAYYESPDESLENAQIRKLDRICRKLRLEPEDHVLEIGTGWGAFAVHAAGNYGCRVTTTTISREQHAYAADWFKREGLDDGRITLLYEDYRSLRGRFDKIVSIEMFEAVGYRFYDGYFGACDRLLTPDGIMLLQTITTIDQTFSAYRRRADWIQKYIFPGSELASLMEIIRSLARSTDLALHHAENIGTHYALTLRAWRARFHDARARVAALGFDDVFMRMWDFYLAACEGLALERQIGDFQLLLTKNHNRKVLFEEPWSDEASRERGIVDTCAAAVKSR